MESAKRGSQSDGQPQDQSNTAPATKAEWIAEISRCVGLIREQRKAGAMASQEIADLDGGGRLVFQRQAIIEGSATLCRAHPNMDCTAAVYTLLIFYTDNNAGCCTISIPRWAKLLSRHEDNIRRALKTLVELGLVGKEALDGKPTRYWPISDRNLANRIGSITWFLDSLAPTRPPGHPTTTRKEEVAVCGTVVPFPGKTPCGGTGGFSAEEEKTPREGMANPPVRSPIESSIKFSEEEEDREGALPQEAILLNAIYSKATDLSALSGDVTGPVPSATQLARFAAEGERWAHKHGKDAKAHLRRIVGALRFLPQVVDQAIDDALNDIATREPDQRTFGAYARYFSKVLNSTAELITKAEIAKREQIEIATTRIQKEHQIAAQGIEAHQRAIEAGNARRATGAGRNAASAVRDGRYAPGPDGRQRFNPNKDKIIEIGKVWICGRDANEILASEPTATVEEVDDVVLPKVRDQFAAQAAKRRPSRWSQGQRDEGSSPAEIIACAKRELKLQRLYAEHGKPEQLAGGPPGRIGGYEQMFEHPLAVIAQTKIDEFAAKYPHGIGVEGSYPYHASTIAYLAFRDAVGNPDAAARYGRGLQQEVEAAIEAVLTKAESKERERKAEELRRASYIAWSEWRRSFKAWHTGELSVPEDEWRANWEAQQKTADAAPS